MVDQRELERLARQGAADIRSGKKKDWEVAQELQAAATGQSQGVEELKGIEGRLAQQGPDGITMIDQSRARGLGIPMQPGASATHSNIGANPEALKIEQMRRANNPTQAESMQRMNSQQPPSGAFGGDSLPGVMQTQPRNIFRNMRDGRVMSGPTPISPPGSVVETPYQPLGSNPTVTARADPNYTQRQMIQQSGQGMRQTPDPRAVPQPAPTIFDSIGSGLKSAGRGMGQYAEKLFNDPNRMAMLQGGLSMMNPNSYYDQQGFGSVFQGLETGLGQAQKGMKGVLDRRKAISDQALVDAKAKQERLGGGKEGVFPSMLTEFLNPNTAPERKKWLERRMKELAPGEGQDKVDDKSFYNAAWKDVFNEQMPKVRGTVSSLKNYINLLDKTVSSEKGILTGPGTSAKVWLGSMLTSMFGADFKGEPLENTQQYLAGMGTMVGEIIKQFGAGTGLSDADRDFAQMISGQKADEFTEDSLKQVLALNEIRMRSDIVAHNHEMEGMLKISDRKYGNLIKSLPRMSKNLREHIKMRVRTGTYGSTNDDGVFEQKKPEGWVDREKGEWDSMIRRAPKTEGGGSAFKIISVRPKQ
jgi:hypothetical protein